jgi:hypothetical protein
MARRASSGVNTQALLIGAAVLALVLGGGFWFINRQPTGFDAPLVDISRDIDNFKSLAGNENSVTGVLVDRQISSTGQIATLRIDGDHFLPIIIPDGFKGGNLNLQDQYTFLVKFNTDGVAVAQDVTQD